MRIKYQILLVMSSVIILTSLSFIAFGYVNQKRDLLQGIDAKLLTAAQSARAVLPDHYHDQLVDKNSVSDKEFSQFVDTFNKLCIELELQYLWSVLVFDHKIVFTSATSPGKDVSQGDHASFFEVHRNPEAFAQALHTKKVTYSSFHNEWGHGRMVLVPDSDSHGRSFVFGASMSISEVDAILQRTLHKSILVGCGILLTGVLVSFLFAGSLSRPLVKLTQVAENIANGHLEQSVEVQGSHESKSLAKSIEFMSRAIRDKISELQDSSENIKITLNSIGDAVIATDCNGIITRMNPVAEKLTGWTEQAAQGRPLTEVFQIVNSFTEREITNPVAGVLENGETLGLANDTTLISRDKTMRQIADSAAPIRNAQGETVGVVLTFRDVTEQYKTESERRRLAKILESTSDFVAISTLDGKITYINKAGRELLGWNNQYEASKQIVDVHPKWAFDIIHLEGIPKAIEDGIWFGETALLNHRGEEIPASQVMMAHKSASGKLEYLSTIIRDISEQKRAEELRIKLEAQLRHAQKLETLGTLAGGIAHDFNNILTPVRGYIEIALLNKSLDAHLRNNLEHVLAGAKRGADLVRQILVFSQKAEQEKKLIHFEHIIDEVLEMGRATLPTTIEIQTEIDPECPPIFADATQMRQIMMNLITNASHAMSEGGILNISLKLVEIDQALASSHILLNQDRYVRIAVRDTGCGMDKTTRERVFEPFFSTKGVGKGSGLGLSVVHGIIANHNGDIIVESELGKGSTFYVYLPPAEQNDELPIESDDKEFAADEEEPLAAAKYVLFVDDEEHILHMGKLMLERFGYQVTTKSGSEEALELFKKDPEQFDLVITDQTMPHMTGLQLAKELLSLRQSLPVILTSGYSEAIDPETLPQSGIRAYLKKPIGISELRAAVREALRPSG